MTDIYRKYSELFGKEDLDYWMLCETFGEKKADERIKKAISEKKPIDWANEIKGWDKYQEDLKNPDILF